MLAGGARIGTAGHRSRADPPSAVTQYCRMYCITAENWPAARRPTLVPEMLPRPQAPQAVQRRAGRPCACPSTGPWDVAFARGAVGMRAATCLRAPAEQQRAGPRTTATTDICIAMGRLTTVCGRPCGDRSQRYNSSGPNASSRRSWRAGSARRSRALCRSKLVTDPQARLWMACPACGRWKACDLCFNDYPLFHTHARPQLCSG